jgi:membrane-associated protein
VTLQEYLLSALTDYGIIVIFITVLISAIGIPLPASFMLLVAGSFIQQGDLQLWPVLITATIGATLGDHIGYGLGWHGGRTVIRRISKRLNAEALLDKAERTSRKWGSISIFFSRWLVTGIGPYINLSSGLTRYRLPIFSLWVVVGEALWVLIYVTIGQTFSTRVAEISDALGDFVYVLLGITLLGIISYRLVQTLRKPKISPVIVAASADTTSMSPN